VIFMAIGRELVELFTGINENTVVRTKQLIDKVTIGARADGARETTDPLDIADNEITAYSRINHTTGETIYGRKKSN